MPYILTTNPKDKRPKKRKTLKNIQCKYCKIIKDRKEFASGARYTLCCRECGKHARRIWNTSKKIKYIL